MAPETLTGGGYTEKIDLWSVGIMTLIILTGKSPYSSCSYKELIQCIRHMES